MKAIYGTSILLVGALILLVTLLIPGCVQEAAPPPELTSLQVLDTLQIAVFDTEATQLIIDYVNSLPTEDLLDINTKQKLQELLLLDAFEVSLVSQATSLRWEPGHPVHVTVEHANQVVTQAPSDTEGTGAFCCEAEAIKRGELKGEYIFFYAADYLKYTTSNFTPDDVSMNPYLVVTTFYSPFMKDKHLVELMGLDSAAIPLQSLAWKMKVDIIAGKSADELVQWYQTTSFQESIVAWLKLAAP